MDPEQGLLIILEYLSVKFQILFLCTLTGILHPERIGIIQKLRSLYDLKLLLIAFLLRLDLLYNHIVRALLICLYGFCLLGICLGKVYFGRHEGTVFLNNLSCLVFIAEFQYIFIDKQGDLRSNLCLVTFCHGKFCTAITFPVNSLRTLFIGKGINVYLISYHKCRIKAKSEMANDLVIICLVLIFTDEVCRSGKSDLVDIFLHLICSHTDTIIGEGQCLCFRIHYNIDPCLIILRQLVLSHHIQLLQLRDRITAVRDQFSVKDIVI